MLYLTEIRLINFNPEINLTSVYGTDDDKDAFYAQLEREYDRCPSHDVRIIIGDLNAQVGQEEEFRPMIGKFSAHQLTNENGLRLIDFAASKNMAIHSTFFQHIRYTWRSPKQTEPQIDHVLIGGRHFSDITQRNIFLSQEQTYVSPKDFGPLNPNPGSDLL